MDEQVKADLLHLEDKGTPNEWSEFILTWAEGKGWNDPNKTQGDWAALIHSEISEAFEAFREKLPLSVKIVDGKPEGVAVEYADALIRILHWFAWQGLDVGYFLRLKMEYNYGRPHKHGGKKL